MNPENATIENIGENPALVNPASDGSPNFKIADCHYRLGSRLIACLTISADDAWSAFTDDVQAHLLDFERAALAEAALRALSLSDALAVAREVIGAAGAPLPPFLGGMDEARFWASYASRSELKVYALASFEAMSAADQAAFIRYITRSEKEIAA